MLIRFLRHPNAWDKDDIDSIIAEEFPGSNGKAFDDEISIYEIGVAPGADATPQILQLASERAADLFPSPPRVVWALDVSSIYSGKIVRREDGIFLAVRRAHCELPFATIAELSAFVVVARARFRSGSLTEIRQRKIVEYARKKLQEGDAEWSSACVEGGRAARWREEIKRLDAREKKEADDEAKRRKEEERKAEKAAATAQWEARHAERENQARMSAEAAAVSAVESSAPGQDGERMDERKPERPIE